MINPYNITLQFHSIDWLYIPAKKKIAMLRDEMSAVAPWVCWKAFKNSILNIPTVHTMPYCSTWANQDAKSTTQRFIL